MYVTLRGTSIDATRHGYARQLAEARSPGYRQALASVLQSVVDTPEAVTAGERALYLRASAADLLEAVPTLPDA